MAKQSRKLAPRARLELATYGLTVLWSTVASSRRTPVIEYQPSILTSRLETSQDMRGHERTSDSQILVSTLKAGNQRRD